MNLTKTCCVAVLLLAGALWSIRASADTEVWQDVSREKGNTVAARAAPSVNWEQRALKRPQTVTPTAQRWVNPRVAQRPSYDQSTMETVPLPAESATPIQQQAAPAEGPEVIEPGATQFEAIPPGSIFGNDSPRPQHGCASCGHGGGEVSGECDDCGPCDECSPDGRCDFGWEIFDGYCGPFLRGLSVFGGVDGFKGPLDRGGANGNFGMNEGLNLARPLGDPWGCGYQIGANFVQSDFSGASVVTADGLSLHAPFRRQYFATAAIFRRAMCRGFQWGLAYDFLHDIYYQNANLQQVRSETAFVLDDTYEIGYYGVYGVACDRDRVVDGMVVNHRVIDGKLDPTDMFVLFVRRNFENGGDGRLWAGATGNGDGLLGADLWVPLGQGFALENRINYMLPKQGRGGTAETRESWGLLVQLVWYPGQNAKCQQKNPYRPIFNVADNSLFMVDRLSQ
jgi:hypothetical protein